MYQLILDKLNGGFQPSVRRTSDNTIVPFNPDNTDYQAYLKWLADGNTPLPAENA